MFSFWLTLSRGMNGYGPKVAVKSLMMDNLIASPMDPNLYSICGFPIILKMYFLPILLFALSPSINFIES